MLQNQKYFLLQEATKYCDYSQEYLSLRARQGRLKSVKLGKNWVTTKEWLKEYLKGVNEFNNKKKIKRISKEISQPSLAFVMAAIFVLLITSIAFGKDGIIQTFEDLNPYLGRISQLAKSYQNFSQNISDKISQASLIDELASKIVSPPKSQFPDGVFEGTINTFKDYGQWLSGEIKEKTRIVAVAIGRFTWKISDSLENAYRSIARLPEKIVEEKLIPQAGEEGLVVIPSTEEDEEVKEKIKEAFSDEVKVELKDKTSGIITPVFKGKEGEEYLYILVPIKN